jgi:DNA helicase-2/ATP-dependent DNA helicase PcrA
MTIPALAFSDLDALAAAFPSIDFTDAERQAVLLEGASRDIQAAPGSGKTTLLAAKLQLMSSKWCHSTRGICVLSHTNVAKDEISKRLGNTAVGAKLLGYPHFVGTIHAFVNQFLALPLLRSDDEAVDVVDNDIFAARALAQLKYRYKLNAWVNSNPHNGPAAIASLRYEGADLELGWETGNLPGRDSDSWKQAKALKDELRSKGVFRFDDMFAFAERLLLRFPDIRKRLSYRFPMVLIDEMQDTSWEQESLMTRVFDETVVVQRFGDRNQRILGSDGNTSKLTFPRAGHLNVTSTKRFSESIAAVVRSVQVHGESVNAVRLVGAHKPVLMLYDPAGVTSVISAFGQRVLSTFSDDVIQGSLVKAICARKQGDSKSAPGRHLRDYWPEFTDASSTPKGHESIHRLLADPTSLGLTATRLDKRVLDVKRAILLALRGAKSPAVEGIRDATYLLRRLESAGVDVASVRMLCHRLAVGRSHTTEANWSATIDAIYAGLAGLLPAETDRTAFVAMDAFEVSPARQAMAGVANEYIVQHEGRSLAVQVATIAAVKGETHLATLVLEAHAHPARCHDLEGALSSIATGKALDAKAKESTLSFYRNLYVATSRPAALLCLAMNRERAPSVQVTALSSKGWDIVYVR